MINKSHSKEEVFAYIRGVLTEDGVRLRFEMSGYEGDRGSCTLHNQKVLNKFAFMGIYDYSHFMALDFYKGAGTLYIHKLGGDHEEHDIYCGMGTVEIIYDILKKTIFSDGHIRRRS